MVKKILFWTKDFCQTWFRSRWNTPNNVNIFFEESYDQNFISKITASISFVKMNEIQTGEGEKEFWIIQVTSQIQTFLSPCLF